MEDPTETEKNLKHVCPGPGALRGEELLRTRQGVRGQGAMQASAGERGAESSEAEDTRTRVHAHTCTGWTATKNVKI
ncbi:hypothetical protein EYF80_002290 [Liparis tanakae]|uniref:Uncharacterized protein n=1 Tax=Liparis tanakae TaxID=230148 RepID=A0A4Z2JCR6_9TELE|nr:hypothetical protein EYF80_002290 [Liparis tanakae]